MSKKITESMLKGLIEEVLKEELLNERTSVDISKWEKTTSGKKKYKQKSFTSSNIGDPGTSNRDVADIDAIAAADGNEDTLSVTDIQNAMDGKVTNQKGRAQTIYKKMDKSVWDFSGTNSPTIKKLSGPLGQSPYNLTDKSTDAEFADASGKILGNINSYADLQAQSALYIKLMKEFEAAHQATNRKYKQELVKMAQKKADHPAPSADPLSSTSAPDLPSNDNAIDISNDGLDIDSRPLTNPLGDVSTKGQYDSENTINTFAGKISVDSSLYNMFNAVAGDDIGAKFSRLNQVAEILDTTKNASLDNATDDQILLFANDLAILSKIGNLAKEMGSSGAGFELEGMLAGLLGGYTPAGKGTSDMITGMDGSMEFYSAKLVASKPGQSWMGEKGGADNGMYHHLKKSNVYYITLFKKNSTSSTTTAATAYDVLEVHITKLNKNSKLKDTGAHPWSKVKGSYLDSAGKFQNLASPLGKLDAGPKIAKGSTPFVSLRLLDNPDASAFAIGERIETFITNQGGILKAVMDASRRIQNMDANTKEYRAVRGSGGTGKKRGGATASLDYVQAIAEDYSKIKSNFQKIFTDTEKTSAKVDGAQVFSEQKVTSDLLKKLIQEKFKK